MKVKQIFPILVIGACSLTGCLEKNTSKAAAQVVETLADDKVLKSIMADSLSHKISDQCKVVEFNKLLKKYNISAENYIIIDKKNCTSTVMSPDGDTLDICEVILGRHVGDKRGGGYGVKGAKLRAYTPAGEFTINGEGSRAGSSNEKLYGSRVLSLGGDHTLKEYQKSQTLALHQVPSSPMGILRESILKNNTKKDNRVSFGCVNYLVKAYDKMRKYIKGKNTKVYILPEEKGNSLHLEAQKDGSFKFFQTKYRTEAQE